MDDTIKHTPSLEDLQGVPFVWVKDERPWGHFIQYAKNQQCTVKIIEINPGEKLSLQTHELRDEYWVALDSGLGITLEGERVSFGKGSEIYIPRGTEHSIENLGFSSAKFLEIAFGHFDEDDIERLEDRYGRK